MGLKSLLIQFEHSLEDDIFCFQQVCGLDLHQTFHNSENIITSMHITAFTHRIPELNLLIECDLDLDFIMLFTN